MTEKNGTENNHDRRTKAIPKQIAIGDSVLIRQKKTTLNVPFDPEPYAVTKVEGNQVTLVRGDSKFSHDKNYVKKIAS